MSSVAEGAARQPWLAWKLLDSSSYGAAAEQGGPMTKRTRKGTQRYSKKSQSTFASAMRRKKRGTLKSGRSGRKVTSRKQAIAIGLSEARKKGAKVPPRRRASSR